MKDKFFPHLKRLSWSYKKVIRTSSPEVLKYMALSGINLNTISKFLWKGRTNFAVCLFTLLSLPNLLLGQGIEVQIQNQNQVSRYRYVALSQDGQMLAGGTDDGKIMLWDLGRGEQIKTFEGHTDWIKSVAFSPDGKILASVSTDKTLKLWNVESGQEIRTLDENSGRYEVVCFSPDGKIVGNGGMDFSISNAQPLYMSDYHSIKLWDVESGKEIQEIKGHTKVVEMEFGLNGKILASIGIWGKWDNAIKIWDVTTGEEISTLEGHTSRVTSISFGPDGKILASVSYDNTLRLWNVETGKETVKPWKIEKVKSLTLSPKWHYIASGDWGGIEIRFEKAKTGARTVRKIDFNRYKPFRNMDDREVKVTWSISLAFSPDEKLLMSNSWLGPMRIWDVRSGKELASLISFKEIPSYTATETPMAEEGDWIVATPDGKFDGSEKGKAFYYHLYALMKGSQAMTKETYFEQYCTKGLLQQVLSGN